MPFKTTARETLFRVVKMSPDEFRDFIASEGIGLTRLAYKIGESMDIGDLSAAESCKSKANESYTRLDRALNMDKALMYAMMGQFFDEAIKFYKALRESKMGTTVSVAAKQFGVDVGYLSTAVHRRI